VALAAALLPAISPAADGLFDLGTLGGTSSGATAVSADGKVVVGNSETTNNAGHHAFRWTQSGGMAGLGTLVGGTNSRANAVSADGSVVVGWSDTHTGFRHGFRWSAASNTLEEYPSLFSKWVGNSLAQAVSADGKVVVGQADTPIGSYHATRWSGSAIPDLGTLGGRNSSATAVSADGSVVVGNSDITSNAASHAFRWTQSVGMADLGTLGGAFSSARAVSADGSVVVGRSQTRDSPVGIGNAFRWTQAGGMADLGTLGGGPSSANAVSADGSVVVGDADTTFFKGVYHAFRWTQTGGMADLGTLGGMYSYANAVSADGRVVVGYADTGNAQRAFRWTQASGMQSVEQWLAANGVTVAPELATRSATAASADGSVVVGQLANSNAFVARVAPLAGLIDVADFNRTLQGAGYIPVQAIGQADLVLNGLSGNPLRGLPAAGRFNTWVTGDWGRQKNTAGDGDVGAGEVGLAYGVNEAIRIKVAVGRTYNNQSLAYDGEATLTGTYVVPEIVAAIPDSSLFVTATGYYNAGDADIQRGYRNAGTPVKSVGSPDSTTSALRLRLDWLNAVQAGDLRLTPYGSVSRYRGRIDGYTETGGGFPVRWDGRTEYSTLGRLGADAAYVLGESWMLLGKLEYVHRFGSQSTGASGTILGLGNFTTDGLNYKENWGRANIGVEGKVGPGVAAVILNATTETNGPSYWAYASYRYDF